MRITQWGEYGVHFAVHLARREREGTIPVGAAEIAAEQGTAVEYAQQILQRLRRGAIVESVRGPLGGYKLARPATEITLLDILIAAEGDSFEVICESKPIDAERCAVGHRCTLRPIWFDLRTHINTFLRSRTLHALAFEDSQASGLEPEEHGALVRLGGVKRERAETGD